MQILSDENQVGLDQLLAAQETFFRSFFQIVGHEDDELQALLDTLRLQFISTLLFVLAVQVDDKEKADKALSLASSGDYSLLQEIISNLKSVTLQASYLYAVTDVYSRYYHEVETTLSNEQKQQVQDLFSKIDHNFSVSSQEGDF